MVARGAVLALLLASAPVHAGCAPAGTDPAVAVRAMLDALAADDAGGFARATTPDFHAFEAGAEFTGDTLRAAVRSAEAGGRRYRWAITAPVAANACDVAWLRYLNEGSVTDGQNPPQPRAWLESAVLRWAGGRWRVAFYHSTPVPR